MYCTRFSFYLPLYARHSAYISPLTNTYSRRSLFLLHLAPHTIYYYMITLATAYYYMFALLATYYYSSLRSLLTTTYSFRSLLWARFARYLLLHARFASENFYYGWTLTFHPRNSMAEKEKPLWTKNSFKNCVFASVMPALEPHETVFCRLPCINQCFHRLVWDHIYSTK